MNPSADGRVNHGPPISGGRRNGQPHQRVRRRPADALGGVSGAHIAARSITFVKTELLLKDDPVMIVGRRRQHDPSSAET